MRVAFRMSGNTVHKVLVADPIGVAGLDLLRKRAKVNIKTGLSTDELAGIIGEYDVLLVRSETEVTAELIKAGKSLQVIGRAGVGVDNIDVDEATRRGIAVVNAPSGNTLAAAEHTIALMLALARNIPQAHNSLKAGHWERGSYVGVEVRNKTLGCVGLGKVGYEVAQRAQGLGMNVIAHDPFVAPDSVRLSGVELVGFDRLLVDAHFISVHVPLTQDTQNIIGRRELELMRSGVWLINTARGGLIDEEALLESLNQGKVAGAALDVFSHEPPKKSPLIEHPCVIVTPHMGASTEEAQSEVSIEVAEQVLDILQGKPARNSVNTPFIHPEDWAAVAPYVPVGVTIGKLLNQLADGQFIGAEIGYDGKVAQYDPSTLTAAVLMGLFDGVSTEKVNLINAFSVATQHGLRVTEQRDVAYEGYESGLISATLRTSQGQTVVAGTLMRGESHIIRVNDYWMDVVPSAPHLLFTEHRDRPGIIGAVGTIAGREDVNISFMAVGRVAPREMAMMVVGLDDPMPASVLEEIMSIPYVEKARLARL